MNWFEVAPHGIALAQVAWEKQRQLCRMKASGLSTADIARRLTVTNNRVIQILAKQLPDEPPIMKWARADRAAAELARKSRDTLPISKLRSRSQVRRVARVLDKKHLAYVASLGCCVPGCREVATVHHLRCQGSTAAAGRKAGDDEAVNLCHEHHQGDTGVHNLGERAFWRALKIDPLALAARLWIESHAGEMP